MNVNLNQFKSGEEIRFYEEYANINGKILFDKIAKEIEDLCVIVESDFGIKDGYYLGRIKAIKK